MRRPDGRKALRRHGVEGRNFVMYGRNRFEHGIALGAWKRRWAVLIRWFVGILVDTHFADMPLFWCLQELSYCRRLRDSIDSSMEVAQGDP